MLEQDANHSAVPVLFAIPYECRPTDQENSDNTVDWTLEVTAKTAGLDYRAEFTVPVFKTSESDPHFVPDRGLIARYAAPEDPERDIREAGLQRLLRTATVGGWSFRRRPAGQRSGL